MTGQTPEEIAREMALDLVELYRGMQALRRNDEAEAEQWLQDRPGREGQKLRTAIGLLEIILEQECRYDVDKWLEFELDPDRSTRSRRSLQRRR
jgi:hypothetical protein